MSNAEKKEYTTDLVCTLYEQKGKYGTFWRSPIQEDGGQFILNEAKEGKDYTFVLTFDPDARKKLEEYKASKGGGTEEEAPQKRSFNKFKRKG